MTFERSVTLLLMILFGCVCHEIEGSRNIIRENADFELEDEQLMTLSKPSIKSIKDETGAWYDCIDINKQPAFDHPLLKDHNIQMTPTSLPFPNEITSDKPSRIMQQVQHIECPEGTVPIRRINKKDLMRAKYVMESQSTEIHPSTTKSLEEHSAGIYSAKAEGTYKGAQAFMNTINPKVEKGQGSSAKIQIFSNATGYLVLAGWKVQPDLYGDNKTHLMSTYKTSAKRGCYICKGFVQVDKHIPIGAIVNVSVYDAPPQWELGLTIHQDQSTKNWWVTLTKYRINLGYWPAALLPGLAEGGSEVTFYGYTRTKVPASPPMGFGKFPDRDFKHSGYFAEMQVINKDYKVVGLEGGEWHEFTDDPMCYQAKYYSKDVHNGFVMMYGGPGGMCRP